MTLASDMNRHSRRTQLPCHSVRRKRACWSPRDPYLAACDALKSPKELLAQPCLPTRFPSGLQLSWEFEKGGRKVKITPRGPLVSSHTPLLMQAAIRGPGYLMTF